MNFKKHLSPITNQKGFTLVEIMVAGILSLIVLATIASLYLRTSENYSKARSYSEITVSILQINKFISSRVKFAYEVQVQKPNGDTLGSGIYSPNGLYVGLKAKEVNTGFTFLFKADSGKGKYPFYYLEEKDITNHSTFSANTKWKPLALQYKNITTDSTVFIRQGRSLIFRFLMENSKQNLKKSLKLPLTEVVAKCKNNL